MKYNVVCLEVSSYAGISLGAVHYYGNLVYYDENENYKKNVKWRKYHDR